jgi:hypothetical protein
MASLKRPAGKRAKKRGATTRPKLGVVKHPFVTSTTRPHIPLQPPDGGRSKKVKQERRVVTLPRVGQPRRTPTVDETRQHLTLQPPKAKVRPDSVKRRRPSVRLGARRLPVLNVTTQLRMPLETLGWITGGLPMPLETLAQSVLDLTVSFAILSVARTPLIVQFDILSSPLPPVGLTVKFNVLDSAMTGLDVSFDILGVDTGVGARLSDDVQAPTAQVTIT